MKINKFSCRKITRDDLEMIMNWRMQPDVTRFMNTDPVLTLEGQIKWFEKLSGQDDFYYWIVEVNGTPCGVVNLSGLDEVNLRCAWGYYVAVKSLRSFELAVSLEMSLYDYVFDVLKLNKITSEAFCENIAATKMHEMCGCETEGILKRHIFKDNRFYDVCCQSMFNDTWKNFRADCKYTKIKFDAF